jgi:hypothetical protein
VVLLGVYLGYLGGKEDESPPKKGAVERIHIVEFVRERLGFEPDATQREVLESNAKRGILNCSRQWGKSTIAAAKAVYRAYTSPKSLILIASPSERQSAELLRKASEMVSRLGIVPRGDGHSAISLLFPNGSRIVGLPGAEGTVRGFSAVSLLLIDEASRMEDAMYKSLRPVLAVGGGDLWLMSTPYGRRGFFYEAWTHGGEDWKRVQVPATECERIPKDFLEEERRTLGAMWFRQEYLCEFMDSGAGVFDRDLVEAALDDDLEPMEKGRR